MKQKTNGKINVWKWLFLLLVAAILGLGIVVMSRMVTYREDTSLIQVEKGEETKIGTFTTTRDQLNDTVATYLEDYQTKDFSYKLYASNQQVLFEGEYAILGQKIPLYIYFQPSKLEDGSVLLTVSEISAGTLYLPKAEILTYLKKNYKLPEFISINAKDATILIQLSAIKNDLKISIKANTVDLYNDQIIFDIYRKK
ncbi:YpmS family protein [Streptococcus ovis]|uniref:YpmS family protein n=1 Tax=Streptococcus ovis TaxID=82806 RepID=UPI00037DE181|nr:YpmS family protein [Streptococcus ovis]